MCVRVNVCMYVRPLELHEATETQLEDSELRTDSLTRGEICKEHFRAHTQTHKHQCRQPTAIWQDDSVCGAHATGKSLNWNKLTIMCVVRNEDVVVVVVIAIAALVW